MPAPNAELLYLLHGDPTELAEALEGMRPADIAEALAQLPPAGAAKVLAALPFDLAVQVFDEPELDRRYQILQTMEPGAAAALVEAMSADQQADLFRELPRRRAAPLLEKLDPTRARRSSCCSSYPPETAGGIMTTEFVDGAGDWTVDADARVRQRGRDAQGDGLRRLRPRSDDGRLVHVVSLRELMVAERSATVLDVGERRATAHRDAARPTAKRSRA